MLILFINVLICYITLTDQHTVNVSGIRESFLITVSIMLLDVVVRLCLNDITGSCVALGSLFSHWAGCEFASERPLKNIHDIRLMWRV
jgi:hypothetical protein